MRYLAIKFTSGEPSPTIFSTDDYSKVDYLRRQTRWLIIDTDKNTFLGPDLPDEKIPCLP